jgi:hypothetical protein
MASSRNGSTRGADVKGTTTPDEQQGDVGADQGVPRDLVHRAIVVGLLLAAAGAALIVFTDRAFNLAVLMTCVGFGIILAAFGARAAGQWRSWSATGAGALAIVLFLLLHYHSSPPPPEFKKRGQIHGDFSKVADLRIVDENPLYTFRDRTTKSIRFIILEKQFKNPRITIQVDTNEKEGEELFEMFGDGKIIADKYFTNPHVEVIKWQFDYPSKIIKDGDDVIFKVPERIEERHIVLQPKPTAWLNRMPMLIGQALASDPTISELIRDLNSDNPIVRRNARDGLIEQKVEAVAPMMKPLRQSPENYRLKVGVTYSLTGILRENPKLSDRIAKELTDEDIRLLVEAASDKDKTVRLQATEFLFNLKDRRLVQPSLEAVRSAKNQDGVYNSVLILKSVYPDLAASEQKRVSEELISNVPSTSVRTRELVNQLKK